MSDGLKGTKSTGICVKFNDSKGYGFIKCNDGTGDVFVHRTEIYTHGSRTLYVGEKVEFDIVCKIDGRRKAVNVTGPNGSYVAIGRFGGGLSASHTNKYSTHLDNVTVENTHETKTEQSEPGGSNDCISMSNARTILKIKFNIPTEFLDVSNDVCYCHQCHADRGDKDVYYRGKPPKPYIVPIGWSRIGLHVDAGKCKINNVWDDWHVAYHGCSLEAAKSIFKAGLHLLKPGDLVLGGNKLKTTPGHIQDGFVRHNKYTKKNEHFDPNQIFVSPSIRYASDDIYAGRFDILGQSEAQCVFQLRIRPGSYLIGQETIGASDDGEIIDKNFSNNELEWYTKENVGIVIYGLLIKTVSNDENKESNTYEEQSDQLDDNGYAEQTDEYENDSIDGNVTDTDTGGTSTDATQESQSDEVHMLAETLQYHDQVLRGLVDQFVENILKELGLNEYILTFAEFGVDQNALVHLEASIIECIMEDEGDRATFLKWLAVYKQRMNDDLSKAIVTEQKEDCIGIQPVYLYQWIDCLDTVTKKWYEAQIIEIDDSSNIKVHFKEWQSKWDTWIDVNDENERVRLLHTFTNKPKIFDINKLDSFKIGTKCDCLDCVGKWCEAQIIDVNANGKLVKIRYKGYTSKYDEWINKDSYRTAKLNTMTVKIVEEPRKCSLCEYENALGAVNCEMCDTKLK